MSGASAATIAFVGADLSHVGFPVPVPVAGSTKDAWRTTSVTKSLDADGNNIYGSDGYFMPTSGSVTPSYVQGLTLPSGTLTYLGNGAFARIDDPASPPTNMDSQIFYRVSSTDTDIVSFKMLGTLSGAKSFRLGILLDTPENAGAVDDTDYAPTTFEVHQIVGGVATSASINGQQGRVVNLAEADWYFFDITGAVANDEYAIRVHGQSNDNLVAIGGLTFDSVAEAPAVPEPSTFVLAALGLAGLGLLAWRRRK
ncbi:MAG: PEP-CTERM sorting domain-containing protein [Planctomycetes bacterium]|nr:PEP-CTERM sorting domain-containing protein [Planctomycetota bacterium]